MKDINEIRARAGEMLAERSKQLQGRFDADGELMRAERKRCFERALREAGYSKNMARRLVARLCDLRIVQTI
jgi:hypothetical protein